MTHKKGKVLHQNAKFFEKSGILPNLTAFVGCGTIKMKKDVALLPPEVFL
jgi:hypothetical protein